MISRFYLDSIISINFFVSHLKLYRKLENNILPFVEVVIVGVDVNVDVDSVDDVDISKEKIFVEYNIYVNMLTLPNYICITKINRQYQKEWRVNTRSYLFLWLSSPSSGLFDWTHTLIYDISKAVTFREGVVF